MVEVECVWGAYVYAAMLARWVFAFQRLGGASESAAAAVCRADRGMLLVSWSSLLLLLVEGCGFGFGLVSVYAGLSRNRVKNDLFWATHSSAVVYERAPPSRRIEDT